MLLAREFPFPELGVVLLPLLLPELLLLLLLPELLPELLLLLEGREEFWRKDLLPLVGFLGEGGTT